MKSKLTLQRLALRLHYSMISQAGSCIKKCSKRFDDLELVKALWIIALCSVKKAVSLPCVKRSEL